MERESIGSSVSSFSSAASFGSEIGSSFSFADTVSYSAPLDISGLNGGSFEPNFNFRNYLNYDFVSSSGHEKMLGLPVASLDEFVSGTAPHFSVGSDFAAISDNIEIPEVFKTGLADINLDPDVEDSEIPQVYYDVFKEDNLLEPQTFLESVNIQDLTVAEPQIDNIEQIITSPEPEIAETEAKTENQSSVVSFQSSDQVFDFVTPEEIKISEQTIVEIEKSELQQSLQPSVIPSDPDQIGRVWESTQLVEDCTPRVLATSWWRHASASPRNDNDELAGTEPEIAGMVVEQVKTQNSPPKADGPLVQKVEKRDEEESASAKALADKEKKGKQLKFVVDEKALAKRRDALQRAIEQTPAEIKDGVEVIDSNKVVANMPTGKEKPAVNSDILPFVIDLLDIGLKEDGSYLEAVGVIGRIGMRSKADLYQEGSGIFRRLPPVALAEDGETVGEKDKDRVFTFKPDPIRQLRKILVYNCSRKPQL